jgi:acyl-coenzyme A synthetase/AMP-(fatty) acid ligase
MPSEAYKSIRATSAWKIPDFFNFGADVVDRQAADLDGPALLWESAAGGNAVYRFSDVARLTDQFANGLRTRGIDKGDRVVVMLPRIPAWPISMVALLKIGGVPIPCVEMLTARDLAFRVENSEARGVICSASQTAKFADVAKRLAVRVAIGGASGWDDFDEVLMTASPLLQPAVVASDDPAVMYYTSGSTGYPKGVVHAARALYAWRVSAEYWLDLSTADRIWCTADTAEGYGQTETLMVAVNMRGEAIRYGSMGFAAPGCDVDVIDEKGAHRAADEEGVLGLKLPNPQLMIGYWQDEERTRSCFIDGPEGRWYVTGDRGRRDAEGYLWFGGRDDDVINSAGYRIGPMEVENVLLEHPAVMECAVVGSPDRERGEIVKAFIVLRPGSPASAELIAELQDYAKAATAPYKYPRAIEFIEELPRTLTGKVKRRELRNREVERYRQS